MIIIGHLHFLWEPLCRPGKSGFRTQPDNPDARLLLLTPTALPPGGWGAFLRCRAGNPGLLQCELLQAIEQRIPCQAQ